jgi:drug/metabolite transporter (DMT)-like permease
VHVIHSRTKAFAALAAAGCLWGTGFLFGKWALAELSVGQLVLYRFLFAAVGFSPAVWRAAQRPETRIAHGDWFIVLAAALLGVPLQFLIQFAGLARTTVTHASLMIGILPVILAAGSALFTHERVRVRRWLALVASTIGAALIAFGASAGEAGSQATLAGDLLVASSLIGGVAWILLCQRLMTHGKYSPINVSAYVMTIGAAMLAVWVVGSEGLPPIHLSLRTWFSVIASGIFATTATTYLWNWGLVRVPASQAGVFLNLEPVVGALLGVALLGDILGKYALIGGVMVIGAAIYVALDSDRTTLNQDSIAECGLSADSDQDIPVTQ